jgi:hypothetical protein
MNSNLNQYIDEFKQLASIIPKPNLELLPLGYGT